MYKVFFNDSSIQFGGSVKKSLKNNVVKVLDDSDYGFVNQFVSLVENEGGDVHFVVEHPYEETAWCYFRKQFKELPAAGGFVRNGNGEFLFIKRLGVWDLPKGKIEKNETPEIAAVREVEEECGLSGLAIVSPLQSTYHIYRSPFLKPNENLVLKETHWFLMEYTGNETPVPQTSEDIVEARWVAPADLKMIIENTYESLRELIEETILKV